MKTVVLIACGSKKKATPCEAKDLYQGSLFKLARQAAERSGCEWAILSAKHGVVLPRTILSPYNTHLKTLNRSDVVKWCEKVSKELKRRWPNSRFFCLAPVTYSQALNGMNAEFPLKNLTLGKQAHYLKHFNETHLH